MLLTLRTLLSFAPSSSLLLSPPDLPTLVLISSPSYTHTHTPQRLTHLVANMADKARPTAGQPAPFIPDLPPEVVRMVTDCCADDPETLANLAQASRDCRALARSYQFATLRLDLSERSRDLIEFLLQDIAEDETAVSPRPRDPDLPPIRECVRRVEVGMVNVDLRGVATETPLPIEEVEDIRERHSLLVSRKFSASPV